MSPLSGYDTQIQHGRQPNSSLFTHLETPNAEVKNGLVVNSKDAEVIDAYWDLGGLTTLAYVAHPFVSWCFSG